MSVNQNKVNIYFERMTQAYGLNKAARIHNALLNGVITPQLRSKVRAVVATVSPPVVMH